MGEVFSDAINSPNSGKECRTYSYIEFLLNPELLDEYCHGLKRDQNCFPPVGEMLNIFLKEASKLSIDSNSQSKSEVRISSLISLAVRLVNQMNYSVEDIGEIVPLKYQRLLINALIPADHEIKSWVQKHRWMVRSYLNYMSPGAFRQFEAINRHMANFSDVMKSANWLENWLNDTNVSLDDCNLHFKIMLEIAEFYISSASTEHNLRAKYFLSKARNFLNNLTEESSEYCDLIPRKTLEQLESLEMLIEIIFNGHDHLDSIRLQKLLDQLENDANPSEDIIQQILDILERDSFGIYKMSRNPDPDSGGAYEMRTVLGSEGGVRDGMVRDDSMRAEMDDGIGWGRRVSLQFDPHLWQIKTKIFVLNLVWRLVHSSELPSSGWLLGFESFEVSDDDFSYLVEKLRDLWGLSPANASIRHKIEVLLDIFSCMSFARLQRAVDGPDKVRIDFFDTRVLSFYRVRARLFQGLHDERRVYQSGLDPIISCFYMDDVDSIVAAMDGIKEFLRGVGIVQGAQIYQIQKSLILYHIRRFEEMREFGCVKGLYEWLLMNSDDGDGFGFEWSILMCEIKDVIFNRDVGELSSYYSSSHPAIVSFFLRGEIPECDVDIIFGALITCENWEVFGKIYSTVEIGLQSHSSVHASMKYKCRFYGVLAEMMRCISLFMVDESSVIDWKPLEDLINLMALEKPSGELRIWSFDCGILSHISNVNLLCGLMALFATSIQYLHRTAKISFEWDIKGLREMDQTELKFDSISLQSIKSICLPNENLIIDIYYQILMRLYELDSKSSTIALKLGDVNLYYKQHREALNYYLRYGMSESNFWIANELSPRFISIIPKIITCLIECKAFTQAIILSQFVDYHDSRKIFFLIEHYGISFKSEYIPYLWKIPHLEALINILKKGGDLEKTYKILALIAKPEINEFNSPTPKLKFMKKRRKMSFLSTLTQEFLFENK